MKNTTHSHDVLEYFNALKPTRMSIPHIDSETMVLVCLYASLVAAINYITSKNHLTQNMPDIVLLGKYPQDEIQKLSEKYKLSIINIEEYKENPSRHLCMFCNIFSSRLGGPGSLEETTYALHKHGFDNYFYISECTAKLSRRTAVPEIIHQRIHEISSIYMSMKDEVSKETYLRVIKAVATGDPDYLLRSSYLQYEHPIVHAETKDIILEGGVCNGRTTKKFSEAIGNLGHIYAFEPVADFVESSKKLLINNTNVTLEQLGLWSGVSTFYIDKTRGGSSSLMVNSTVRTEECHTIDIDSYCKQNNITCTMIKLDVEGAELETLRGAHLTIAKLKPKLHLSLYHKISDYIDIPLLVLEKYPEYSFFCGHHSSWNSETMLYAISN